MKAAAFDYWAPETLAETVDLLSKFGDEAKLLAGGQSLVPLLSFRLARPTCLIDLNGLAELDHVRLDKDSLVTGSMTRQRTLEMLPMLRDRCPMISEAVDLIGHIAIRNRGTVGGSLAHADPAAEWPGLLLALDGECQVAGPRGFRTIPARDLFVTYFTTSLDPDEVLTEVRLPLPDSVAGTAFVELARRHGDFALVGVAVVLSLSKDHVVRDVRIALVGAGATPLRAAQSESALRGEQATDRRIAEAAALVDASADPVSDVHVSATYRRKAARVLARRALTIARERALARMSSEVRIAG